MKTSDENAFAQEAAKARVKKAHEDHGYHPYFGAFIRVSESKRPSKNHHSVSKMILVEVSPPQKPHVLTQGKRKYLSLDKDPELADQVRVNILRRQLDLSEAHTFYLETSNGKTK